MTAFPGFSLNLPVKEDTTYQGWANYPTFNVALYINNEYPFYKAACSYVAYQKELGLDVKYKEFIGYFMDLLGTITPDGVSWNHPELDTDELNELLEEI